MGTNIIGYIEINSVSESEEDIWFEITKIDVLAERDYEIFAQLFGVRSETQIAAIAASRGIPKSTSNPSSLTCPKNTFVGHSWANWSELKSVRSLIESNGEALGWQFIFQSMELLSKRYAENNVRLVVAFDNHG